MDFKYLNSKKSYLAVEITQLLYKYGCTYNETDEILQLITNEIQQQRENKEYDTVDDYFNGIKRLHVDDEIISPLNHVEPYA